MIHSNVQPMTLGNVRARSRHGFQASHRDIRINGTKAGRAVARSMSELQTARASRSPPNVFPVTPQRHLEDVGSAGRVEHVRPLEETRERLAILAVADEAEAGGRRDVACDAAHAAAPAPKRERNGYMGRAATPLIRFTCSPFDIEPTGITRHSKMRVAAGARGFLTLIQSAPARSVGRVTPLRHDPLEAHAAGVMEHRRTLSTLEVLAQAHALARFQRLNLRTNIIASRTG
jgi:hypothetical protein